MPLQTPDLIPFPSALVGSMPVDFPTRTKPCTDTDEILQRIDDAIDLIAQANQVACGARPVDHIDVSVIVPAWNCRDTLPDVLDRIAEVMPPATETIVVDDGSTDGTWHYLRGLPKNRIKVIRRRRHHGRGSALRLAIRHTQGRVIAVQDADMAYDPAELLGLIWPILEHQADAVYGSRFLHRQRPGFASWLRQTPSRFANWCVTLSSNATTGLRLSDMQAGQKAFRGDLLRSLTLSESACGFDAELTAKIARRADVVMEAATHYQHDAKNQTLGQRLDRTIQLMRSVWQHRTE